MRVLIQLVLGCVAAMALTVTALAQGTYTQVDYAGAKSTVLWGVNAAGDVDGGYIDSSGVEHGFLLSGGVYTTIDYPGFKGTELHGMNDLGQITGDAVPPDGFALTGFVYDVGDQTFTVVTYPDSVSNVGWGINNSGTVVGSFKSRGTLKTSGFELLGSTYSRVVPAGNYASSEAMGVGASNQVVGNALNSSGITNYLFDQVTYRRLNIPNAAGATVYSVNPSGTALVGVYAPTGGMAGFVYQNGHFRTLKFPGSSQTFATGINGAGEVVGYFFNTDGIDHGFTWTP